MVCLLVKNDLIYLNGSLVENFYEIQYIRGDKRVVLLKNNLDEILNSKEMENGIKKYTYIIQNVKECDVSQNEKFQTMYNAFFRIGRKKEEYYKSYFKLLELSKKQKLDFEDVLRYIYEKTGEYHCSFSSKLVAVLNPKEPIWDKEVATNHFGYKLPYYGVKNREKRIIDVFNQYRESFYDYTISDEGKNLINAFDKKFPIVNITDTKKVDFILWLDREKK